MLFTAAELSILTQQQGPTAAILPNQEILQNLARVAQGSLYIIDEITPEKLIGIIAKER